MSLQRKKLTQRPHINAFHRGATPATHRTSDDDPAIRYVVRDKDWAVVWGADLDLESAQRLKEKTAGRRRSTTVRFEPMPAPGTEEYAYLVELGWVEAEPKAEQPALVVPPPAPVRTAPAPAAPRGHVPSPAMTPRANANYAVGFSTGQVTAAAMAASSSSAGAAQRRAAAVAPPAATAVLASGLELGLDDLGMVGGTGGPEPITLTPEQLEAEAQALEDMAIEDILGGDE